MTSKSRPYRRACEIHTILCTSHLEQLKLYLIISHLGRLHSQPTYPSRIDTMADEEPNPFLAMDFSDEESEAQAQAKTKVPRDFQSEADFLQTRKQYVIKVEDGSVRVHLPSLFSHRHLLRPFSVQSSTQDQGLMLRIAIQTPARSAYDYVTFEACFAGDTACD